MKPLYYSALAPPQVAPALAFQAQESLRPVIAYLNAAKAAAKEREVRSRVQWTAVPVERTIQLHASDSLLEIAGEGGGYDVVGWSGPAPSMPLFVGAQFRPVQPVRVDESGGRVVVWLAEVLSPDELVFWAGIRCQLQAAAPIWPTQVAARRADGRVAQVLHREEVGGGLRIVVEGTDPVTLSTETGAPVSHRVLVASDGAIRLRGNRTEIEWNGEHELHVAALPDTPTLLASNGVRWTWQERVETSRRRRGVWIQLLAPDDPDEIQADSTIDARAAFCDEGVREVRTKKGGNKGDEFRVFGFRRDTYRLELDRLPPEGSTLFLPSKLAGLNRQLNAVYRLKDSPLPHHRGLLTLCEDPTKVRWPDVRPEPVTQWHLLADDQWDGTVEQREFVSKALATNDFAFLEGPPGSGKTHAICELVLQLVERQQRVLLCSTTHVAVDNVLERLITKFPQIEAIRVGLSDRVDPRVRSCQLDERVERLAANWKSAGAFSDLDDQQLDAAAESIVLAGANLTCGTTTGILSHPYIRRVDAGDGPSWPHFDVLIIDEASKTTFQEFLVPAQLARKWIIVGDVRQLPPFTDPRDLEASLADVSDEAQRRFPPPWQRACLLRFKLGRPEAGAGRIRWLIEESVEVLDALMSECAHTAQGASTPMIARIVERATRSEDVTVRDLETGQPAALRLAAADWVLLPRGLRSRIERYLPAHLLPCSVAGNDEAARFRRAHWLNATGRLQPPVRDGNMQYATAADVMAALQEFFGEETWASQVAWRLGRVHQLASARNDQNRLRRQAEVDALMPVSPAWQWVETATDAIRDVGVRSVIESLRVRRVDHRVRRKSALTEAIPDWAWKARSVLLTYQHRMHRDISALPRELFYEKTALRDANTLTGRDAKAGWNFLADAGGRRVWLDVAGTEERGVNRQEVTAMEDVLRRWVASAPPRRADGQPWEIACLSFYSRQELAIRDMLRRLTGQPGAETRFALPNAAIVGGTVDRFQGREADMVLLSLRNTRRTGHLDSPNRLNVAITRARFMLVIIGHRSYFTRCPSEELTALAAQSPVLALGGRR
jgi:hypothetical protein